jgi:hypothetical protein
VRAWKEDGGEEEEEDANAAHTGGCGHCRFSGGDGDSEVYVCSYVCIYIDESLPWLALITHNQGFYYYQSAIAVM